MNSAEIGTLEDAFAWSISRLARAFDKHRDTVRKRITEAGIAPAGKRHGTPVYRIKDVAAAIVGPDLGMAAPGADNDPDQMTPVERRAWFQSENERIKLEQELGHLIPDHEMAREMSRFAKNIAAALESLPDVLERDAGLEGEALDVVQRITDEFREQMYREYVAGDDDDS